MKRSGVICYCIVDCLTGCLCFHHCLDILSIERLGTAMPKAGKEWLQVGAYSCRTKPGLEKSSVVLYTDDAVNLAVHTGEKRVKKTFPVFFSSRKWNSIISALSIMHYQVNVKEGVKTVFPCLPTHPGESILLLLILSWLVYLSLTNTHQLMFTDKTLVIGRYQLSTLLCSWEQPVIIKTLFCHFQVWLSL